MATDSVAGRIATLTDAIATVKDGATSMEDTVGEGVEETKDALVEALDATKERIADDMEDAIAALKAQIDAQKKSIDAQIKDKLDARTKESSDINDQFDSIEDRLAERQKCQSAGKVYSAKDEKCIELEVADGASMARVSHVGWSNNDGRDSGYLNNRNLKFVKYYDDTYIRVLYYDNLRVHGHTAHGRWNLLICDENANGCAHCTDPGKMQNWRYSSHQGNWWMNDHVGATIFGLCRKTENRELKKGTYYVRAYIDNARYDLYTGSNQYGSFTVDEVMKY